MADFTLDFDTKWDAVDATALADNGTAESALRDNSTNGNMCAWVFAECSNGTGADADGSTLYLRPTLDDGTKYADANSFVIGTLPSPDGSTISRSFFIANLPRGYKVGIKNETGASADYDVDVVEAHVQK